MVQIQEKIKKITQLIAFILFLFALRIYHLSITEHQHYKALATQPQRKIALLESTRGTIRDRFNIPLSINQIEYSVSIIYDPIRTIRRSKTIKSKKGTYKIYPRKEYVLSLSQFLSSQLDIPTIEIEDQIYSYSALFPHSPYSLKGQIDEQTYYSLLSQEKNWPGLHLQMSHKRYYPYENTACHILGYMGAINSSSFYRLEKEKETLQQFLSLYKLGLPAILPEGYSDVDSISKRYTDLNQLSYSINSKIGKAGVEKSFDEDLRGKTGKDKYEIDIKGNILRSLPGSYKPISGKRLLLSISIELQQFAEKLLQESELFRESRFPSAGRRFDKIPSPWIKGGSIIAMDPSTGEILTLASYPTFNPNHFAGKNHYDEINKYLENNTYIASLWDGKMSLERTFCKHARSTDSYDEKQYITWPFF